MNIKTVSIGVVCMILTRYMIGYLIALILGTRIIVTYSAIGAGLYFCNIVAGVIGGCVVLVLTHKLKEGHLLFNNIMTMSLVVFLVYLFIILSSSDTSQYSGTLFVTALGGTYTFKMAIGPHIVGCAIPLVFIFFKKYETESTIIKSLKRKDVKYETPILNYPGNEFHKKVELVNDYANILSKSYKDKIIQEIIKVKDETSVIIVIVTVGSLVVTNIDDYSLEMYNTLGLDRNGVLVTIAVRDKKIRITTGHDIRKVITNDIADSVINDIIIPKFKINEFNKGIYQGVKKISEYILSY